MIKIDTLHICTVYDILTAGMQHIQSHCVHYSSTDIMYTTSTVDFELLQSDRVSRTVVGHEHIVDPCQQSASILQ